MSWLWSGYGMGWPWTGLLTIYGLTIGYLWAGYQLYVGWLWNGYVMAMGWL